jgi:4-hydroxybenzoate polyprenyltransferase
MRSFLMHLRLPYMFGVLSAPYLVAHLFVQQPNWFHFFIVFLTVHTFLFGGATAFNSYWDKDEGPVGGLKNPPKMNDWMRWASLALMLSGWLLLLNESLLFHVLYGISFFLFWVYSSPIGRWKGHPWLSLLTIGVSTGSNSFLMALLALGLEPEQPHFLASLGVACMLTAMYPVSQIFQLEEDEARGDITFALKYGFRGIIKLYWILNLLGLVFLSTALIQLYGKWGSAFFYIGLLPILLTFLRLKKLTGKQEEYEGVMRLKYLMSFSFVGLSVFSLLFRIFFQ